MIILISPRLAGPDLKRRPVPNRKSRPFSAAIREVRKYYGVRGDLSIAGFMTL